MIAKLFGDQTVEAQPKERKRKTHKKKAIEADLDPVVLADRAIQFVEVTVTFGLNVDGKLTAIESALIRPGLIRTLERIEPETIKQLAGRLDTGSLILGGLLYTIRVSNERIALTRAEREKAKVTESQPAFAPAGDEQQDRYAEFREGLS